MHDSAVVLGSKAGPEMIAKHTLTHAIQYLRDAAWSKGSRSTVKMDDAEALRAIGPAKPCAAYGLAKRTLRRCGSLDAAIEDLQLQVRVNKS